MLFDILPNPDPAFAAKTIAVIRPARASNPNRPMRMGLQELFYSIAAWAIGGGFTNVFCLE